MPDDESFTVTAHHDEEPAGARTPPAPHALLQQHRQRSMVRLRPVSIPDMVWDLAGQDAIRAMGDFVSHYMPDGR